jgi:hypothetical protein
MILMHVPVHLYRRAAQCQLTALRNFGTNCQPAAPKHADSQHRSECGPTIVEN